SGRDSESDGLPDNWERFYFEPILGPSYLVFNGTNDYDSDGATHADEFTDGTDPTDPADFVDVNGDGYYDGIPLTATDGFGTTSFNAGTNRRGGAAPAAGRNYIVNGVILRTPGDANITTVF